MTVRQNFEMRHVIPDHARLDVVCYPVANASYGLRLYKIWRL